MHYESHFGVYALILHPDNGNVLVIKKALGCYTGLYDLPGGSMEPHEVLEETLKREVFEETGCTVTSASQLETFSILYPHVRNECNIILRHIGCIYLATITGTPRESSDGSDDSAGCLWVSQAAIDNKTAAPFIKLALDRVSKQR